MQAPISTYRLVWPGAAGISGVAPLHPQQMYREGGGNRTGSPFRQGKSLVAVGGNTAALTVAIGGAATLTFDINEAGRAGKLIINADAGRTLGLAELSVTSIKYDNDELVSGSIPSDVFAADSVASPAFGHYFEVNHQLTIAFQNDGAGAKDVMAGFTIF